MNRWSQPNGYRDVLTIGLPLVISMGSTTVMQFTDRIFLGNYSLEAIAAATPAGIASFLFIAFFMGVGTYVNVFIAQYVGSGNLSRVGASVWQGIYFCLGSAVVLALLYFVAEPLFELAGHPPEVRRLEVIYFRVLTLGAGLAVLGPTLGSFFSGRGLTRPIMIVNVIGAAVNIPLDYALINGVWIFPELGIAGAGLATVSASGLISLMMIGLIFTRANDRLFAVRRNRALDRELMGRLLKFGLPNGIQFFIDMFAIAFFIFMVGRLGKAALAASNIVFAIDTLAFLPIIGFNIAVSTLVGQAIGRGRPDQAMVATSSTIHIALGYMIFIALVFILLPEHLVNLFRTRGLDQAQYQAILDTGVVLLRFVAIYTIFDAWAIIYAGSLKGAGDTRFIMCSLAVVATGMIILPLYIGVELLGTGLIYAFTWLTLYVAVLASIFWLRYRQGKWQGMRVIETEPLTPPEQLDPEGAGT